MSPAHSNDDLITTENRRLRNEVEMLRERVAAFEASRWWRLHPRSLGRGLTRVTVSGEGELRRSKAKAKTKPVAGEHDVGDALASRFRDEVMTRGVFTRDWFSGNIGAFEPLLQECEGRSSALLEIGSFEGLSACYFLWRLASVRVTCIDTFEGSAEHVAYGDRVSTLEELFDRNVALTDASRVRKIRGDSRQVLLELAAEGALFDIVYIDGSHFALDVLVDAALSWQLLASEGVLIFDDYTWTGFGSDPLDRPGPAIDSFLRLVGEQSELVFRDKQVAVRKSN